MEIRVSVNDIDLNTVVGQRVECDEDGDRFESGGYTIADAVVEKITKDLSSSSEYRSLRCRVAEIRDELIRARCAVEIERTFAQAITKTNIYGEPTGQTTTLTELIIVEANRTLTQRDGYGSGKTMVQKLVSDAVNTAMKRELAAAISAEKDRAVSAIRTRAASLIADAIREGIGS